MVVVMTCSAPVTVPQVLHQIQKRFRERRDGAFDIALIDVNPSTNMGNAKVICLADFLLTPVVPDQSARKCVRSLERCLPDWALRHNT